MPHQNQTSAQASQQNQTASQNQASFPSEENLRQDLEAAQQKIQELTEMSKRALADLANFRKRVEDERASFAKFASLSLILEILPILDNFQRALRHVPEEWKESEWVKGVLHIEKQLEEVVKKCGLEEIPSPVGQPFDPLRHEAITQAPGAKDMVLEELDAGYMLDDKVVRPTKVKVGDGTV